MRLRELHRARQPVGETCPRCGAAVIKARASYGPVLLDRGQVEGGRYMLLRTTSRDPMPDARQTPAGMPGDGFQLHACR